MHGNEFPVRKLKADDETVVVKGSERHNLSANTDKDQDKSKKNAVKKLDQSLKFLKSLNDTFPRDESTKYEGGFTKYANRADVSQELKQSTSNFPSTIKCAASEPSKC